MTDRTKSRLALHVAELATDGLGDWLEDTGDDTLYESILDFDYLCGSDREIKEIHLLVSFGGPNIWVHITRDGLGTVHGYWGGERSECVSPHDLRDVFDYYAEALS